MANRELTLLEHCCQSKSYTSQTPTPHPNQISESSRLTMTELCYPDPIYVPSTQMIPSDYHPECWIEHDTSSDHSDTLFEPHGSDIDPTL